MVLKYILCHKAWYAEANKYFTPQITVIFESGNGSTYEFGIVYHPTAKGWRLEIFDDAWPMLAQYTSLYRNLALLSTRAKYQTKEIAEEIVVAALVASGFRDATPYVQPEEDKNRFGRVGYNTGVDGANDSNY